MMINRASLATAFLASVIPLSIGCKDTDKKNNNQGPMTLQDAIDEMSRLPSEDSPIINDLQLRKAVPVSMKVFSIRYDLKDDKLVANLKSDDEILDLLKKNTSNSETRNKRILEAFKDEADVRVNAFLEHKFYVLQPLDLRDEPPIKLDWSPESNRELHFIKYGFPFSKASMKESGYYFHRGSVSLRKYLDTDGKIKEGIHFEYTRKSINKGEERLATIVPSDIPIVIYHYRDSHNIDFIDFIDANAAAKPEEKNLIIN
ncbi:MAG: hypothetical protein HY094_07150 [Candidatus Melainabacteria bacterium]|nr:hypothetical protein [Candidatus Melainabacteria bacterium]